MQQEMGGEIFIGHKFIFQKIKTTVQVHIVNVLRFKKILIFKFKKL